jgi:hypothetical protein
MDPNEYEVRVVMYRRDGMELVVVTNELVMASIDDYLNAVMLMKLTALAGVGLASNINTKEAC